MYRRFLWLTAFVFSTAGAWAQLSPAARQIASRLTANSLKADVSFLASDALQGRATPSPGLDIAAEYIAAQFRRAGLEPAGDDGYFQTAALQSTPNPDGRELTLEAGEATLKAGKDSVTLLEPAAADLSHVPVSVHIATAGAQSVKVRNVAGLLRGSDPALKDTYVLITGHYDHLGVRGEGAGDHIYNGANDDASGTSSVIEIANALAALPDRPRRSIVFMALFGEEVGRLGSRYYCQHPIFPLARTVADINLEQLGRTDDTEGPRLLQFNLTGFDYSNIAASFKTAGEETGIKVVRHERNSDLYFGESDDASFADVGIPSTTISVSYDFPDYHQPGDEWQKLDYENMAKVDVAVAVGILKIAGSVEAPRWNKDNPKAARYINSSSRWVTLPKPLPSDGSR